MPITQKEIALRLGLSRQIVGHALTGNPHVAESTRKRVLEAAAELGYSAQSNQAARSLIAQRYGAKAKKDAIAVLMPSVDGDPIRKLPYFIPIMDGIEIEAASLDVDVSLHALRIGHMPRYIGDFLVDGVIGFTTTVERNEWMHQHGLPQVLIDGGYPGISTIHADYVRGISLCTQHLIDLGHTRIAYFAQQFTSEYPTGMHRLESFKATMNDNGIEVSPDLIWTECVRMQRWSAAESMARILERGHNFTAIVCYNDLFAMGVVDALQQAGRRIPDDISVTGFDDISRDYGFNPEITSISFDREEMGRHAVHMLYTIVDAMIEDPLKPAPTIKTVLPVKLAIHQSTSTVISV